MKWAHRKADLFQQKWTWHHKCKYDKWSKAVSLRMRDMVLVHITTFKGIYKIQNMWEKREYIVEQQPYPNLPMSVVPPIDWEGAATPYTEPTFCPSAITWNRRSVTMLWREKVITN